MTVFITIEKAKELYQQQPQNSTIIDCRFNLVNVHQGEEDYAKGHAVNAPYWSLEHDLSDMAQVAEKRGRHPMPTKAALAALFKKTGLKATKNVPAEEQQQIFLYDNGASPFATRAFYVLHYAGFENVFIINAPATDVITTFGTTTDAPVITQTDVTDIDFAWKDDIYVDLTQIEDAVKRNQNSDEQVNKTLIIDTRAYIRYIGEKEPVDFLPGRIPTAKNYDWQLLQQPGGIYTTTENDAVIQQLQNLIAKCDGQKYKDVIVQCGSGVTATPVFAMCHHLGLQKNTAIRLYMNSYSEWIANQKPVATGPDSE